MYLQVSCIYTLDYYWNILPYQTFFSLLELAHYRSHHTFSCIFYLNYIQNNTVMVTNCIAFSELCCKLNHFRAQQFPPNSWHHVACKPSCPQTPSSWSYLFFPLFCLLQSPGLQQPAGGEQRLPVRPDLPSAVIPQQQLYSPHQPWWTEVLPEAEGTVSTSI